MKRSELPDEVFGIPEERKYPMPDKRHTLSAIKLFGHVEPKYEEELAKNIIKNMKKYNIPESAVGKDNKLRKYIDKYYNESAEVVEEKYIMNEDDIYYNKDKFDAGITNLCFITGHGGSGKSTMGEYMAKEKNIEHVEMDDVIWCWRYINKPFESGSMLESFFTTGPGKKYFGTSKQEMRNIFPNYDEDIIREFMDFAYNFAKTHKNKKYAIEGVQLFLYINPEELTDYAVYIKGTSACVSIFRAVKRDYQKYKDATTSEKIKKSIDRVIIKLSNVKETERAIEKYRKYFSGLMQANESAELIEERYLINDKDIYYNKDKFDSGKINLCFITGHSGSGKSTMGRNMQSDNIEHYELDDLQCIKDHFTMQNLKEYGDLIYSYFNGQGKRFYVTYQDLKDNNTPGSEYEDILFKDFVHYAMKYAKAHKNKKYVIEGVWLYCDDDNGTPWFTPEEFKDYAFYIKGTSAIISKHRAALRDAREDSKGNKINTIKIYLNDMIRKNWKWYLIDEKALNKFRKYFSGLMQTNESTITESFAGEYERVEVPLTEEVLIEAANNAARHTKWCKMESFPFCSVHELQSCLVSVKNASFAFATFDGSEEDLNYVINSCNRNNTFRYGTYEVSCIPNSQGTKYLCGKITDLYDYVKKSTLLEEARLDNTPDNMYHLSTENHNGDVFEPRYYDNDNVKAGTERRVKRICFSDSINGCIYSIFPSGAYDVDLYVHVPGSEVTKVYETTPDDIYDSKITHELWVKEPVTMKCIGKIHISGVYKDKVKVLEADKDKTGYGKRKYYEPRWNWVEKINEAYIEEQSTSSVKVYHLSQSNLDGKTLSPRVPSNYFTKNGYEDGKTARICFAKSIDMCLRALSQKCTDMELFVHIPDGKYNIYIPSTKELPDAKITSEVWIKEPVKLKCIGKIKVIKDKGENGIPYKYGDNTAELYDWEWKWIEKINEASIVSNVQDDYNPKGKKSLSSFKKEKISKDSLDKYKKDFKALSHIRENCLGYIYLDKNIPMAVIAVEEKSDCNFIQAVEIAKNYQGYGLSKQLLDVATKELKATRLSVNKKNKLAIEIYKKYGFKKYDESESMVFMSINETNLKEFSVGAGPVVGIGSNPEPIYIVNYIQNNVFSGATQERFGICKAGMKDLHTFGGKYNRLHYTNLEEFEKEASNIKVYRYTGPLSDKYPSIYSIIEDADTDLDFYRLLTGDEIDNRSSIKYDPYFQRESYINDELSAITECVVAGVKELDNKYEIPMIGLNEDGRVYNYYRDLDGVYIKNEVTNMRSGSYDDISDIPEEVNNLVIKGIY